MIYANSIDKPDIWMAKRIIRKGLNTYVEM